MSGWGCQFRMSGWGSEGTPFAIIPRLKRGGGEGGFLPLSRIGYPPPLLLSWRPHPFILNWPPYPFILNIVEG